MGDQRPPQIGPEEILREGGASQPVKPHSFVELTGAKLALAVGGLGAAVTLVLVAYWVWTAPVISLDLKEGDPEKLRQVLDLQKQVAEVHLEGVVRIFDSIVVKCLLPLLTTILGYIFGSNTLRRSSRD
jgi:hypothetical protein